VVTLVSSGLGPYWMGKISGMTGSLAVAVEGLMKAPQLRRL
jgi:hypothetical protein